jgi:hypothetical protein
VCVCVCVCVLYFVSSSLARSLSHFVNPSPFCFALVLCRCAVACVLHCRTADVHWCMHLARQGRKKVITAGPKDIPSRRGPSVFADDP